MPITFDLSKLTSRTVKAEIGKRVIIPRLDSVGKDPKGNIITQILGGIGNLVSFAIASIFKTFSFSWTAVWGLVVQAKTFIYNFNWQATDDELTSQINTRLDALAGQVGGFLGNAFGYLVCGALPGALMLTVNAPLGAYILKNVGEEAADEIIDNLSALTRQVFNLGTQIFLTALFKNTRKLIKQNSEFISKLFGKSRSAEIKKAIDSWGNPNQKPWSFAIAHEERLEKITNTRERNFKEEFAEEFDEACIEAGFIVGNSVDSWLAQDALSKQINPVLGAEKFVEITLNRKVEDKKIILGGNEQLLKANIINTLSTHTLLDDRDLGIVYTTDNGQPIRSLKPEVVLWFYQSKKDRVIGTLGNGKPVHSNNPIKMKMSFRLMNKSEEDFRDDKYIKELAAKVYQKLATPPFRAKKGKEGYTYTDHVKGYQFLIWTTDATEARRIVEQVLDIQNHSLDSDNLKHINDPVSGKRKTKRKEIVLGKTEEIELPGNREGVVTFTHAYLNIGNGTDSINLVDLTGRKRNVIYKPV